MALTYTIKNFEVDENDSSKTMVGFTVIDDTDDSVFLIDKLVTTASKTDNAITQEAYTAAQTEVDEWVASRTNIGKTWNPDTNAME
jgi:hypothetical protein